MNFKSGNVTEETPIHVTYRLLEGEELERVKNPPPAPQAEKKPPAPVDMKQALADLKSSDRLRRRGAAGQLAQAEPNEQRDEVAKSLESLLTDSDKMVRRVGAQALAVWGTADSVAALIKLVDDSDQGVRADAIAALGKLKDERGAEAVASRLGKDRAQAIGALQAMGAVAENAVAKLLKDSDRNVRHEACRILGQIGTKESIAALEAAGKDSDRRVARAAADAVSEIRKR